MKSLNNLIKLSLALCALCLSTTARAQADEYFTPYQKTALRLPSWPLIVNDPYLSIWSPFDKINGGTTRHWSDQEMPLDALLRVDGTTYRVLGAQRPFLMGKTLLPMADEGAWEAPVSYNVQNGTDWTKEDFDDSGWSVGRGAFGSPGEYPNVNTRWDGQDSDIYVRRKVTLTEEDMQKNLFIMYSHDDVFELYVNGVKAVGTGNTWMQGETINLEGAVKNALHVGENIIAAHCHNTTGGALIDYGLFENASAASPTIQTARQLSIDVMATSTYVTMRCGKVDLDLVFTAPMLIDDLDLMSTPINYISYRVRSNDDQQHNVQFYFAAHPELASSSILQKTSTSRVNGDIKCWRTGCTAQNYLNRTGDLIKIDWGYFYLPEVNGTVGIYNTATAELDFEATGEMPASLRPVTASRQSEYPTLAYTYNFGDVTEAANFLMVGYDEVWDMRYMGKDYKGYWARDGKTIQTAFKELYEGYDGIMTRCRQLDKMIWDDAFASGGTKYAELLAGSYRHVIAAHKIFQDDKGNVLFFSKENNSGGFVNTVDLTYPESPLFLLYNTELQKGMMISIFDYCISNRWGFNFAAHDLGFYPHANGQSYSITRPDADGGFGGNMPLEETGNMLTLAAMITLREGNTDFIDRYWDVIQIWADYLAENGQDPANQLCTDDFAGFLAHNANLSVKAIMGVAGFALMAKAKGLDDLHDQYMAKARSMAQQWEVDAIDGRHYKLALDRSGTWSQKYNMVWDKLWETKLFSDVVMTRETAYYLTKLKTYGLPLDSRGDITKADWIMWTAAMAESDADFQKQIDPLYKYVNTTTSRVPLSDFYDAASGKFVGFRARSVIGGFWMKVLFDKFSMDDPTMGITPTPSPLTPNPSYYNANGIKTPAPTKGLNIIRKTDGTATKIFVK